MIAVKYKHNLVQEGAIVEVHIVTSSIEERSKKQLFLAT